MMKLICKNNLEVVKQINSELSGAQTLSTEQNVESSDKSIGIEIQPIESVLKSLGYMWKGMLGIFIIIGIIIGVVTILNKVKTKK